MLVSQVVITFHAVMRYPGETLEGLAERINQMCGDLDAARYLISDSPNYNWLYSRIHDDIQCIVEREGKYYFDPSIRPYSKDPIFNPFLEAAFKKEKERILAKGQRDMSD